jgi:hypothetical protein
MTTSARNGVSMWNSAGVRGQHMLSRAPVSIATTFERNASGGTTTDGSMIDYNWPPEEWPALMDKPYCARPGCPNPASHVEFAPTDRCHVRALCRWHTPDKTGWHLPIAEYLERRAGGLVRASLKRLNAPPGQLHLSRARAMQELGSPLGRKLR